MDLNAVTAGLYAVLKAEIPGLHTPDNPLVMPTPPGFVVSDFDVELHKTMRYYSEVVLTARAIVSRADSEQGGIDARKMLGDGAGSIFYAIEKPHILSTGSQTFGGTCDQGFVESIRGYRAYVYAGTPMLGVEYKIRVIGERAA